MSIYLSTLTLPGAEPNGENPLPFFRDRLRDQPLTDAGLTEEERTGFRYETGFRILPYRMQDEYTRALEPRTLRTAVLENTHLRATFLTGYGGRLWSLFDKDAERELLFSNPAFRPANLAIRNAWFAGGIEWNFGQFGHTCLTCEPMFFARCTGADGEPFLRMYEYERQKRLFLQIDFHLPKDSRCLFAHVCLQNSAPEPSPLYWWTNIAVREEKNIRVFSSSDDVIYIRPETLETQGVPHAFTHGTMPCLESLNGVDASYPQEIPYSCEYFFQNAAAPEDTWEAAAYDDGAVFWERSTPVLRYRKMFCWGKQRGGAHWKEFLSHAGEGDYLEIQAGLSPTQVHGLDIAPGGRVGFTQAFGGTSVRPDGISAAWQTAKEYLYGRVEDALPAERLLALDAAFAALESAAPEELLTRGSGWGALEAKRAPGCVPQGMRFPVETLGEEQKPWLRLLEKGAYPAADAPDALPPSWMTDSRWTALLQRSLEVPENRNAAAYLQLGVMLYESGDRAGGLAALEESDRFAPTAVCAYCRAQTAAQDGDFTSACKRISRAVELGGLSQSRAFAEAYIDLHNRAGRFAQAWQFYAALPEHLQSAERIRLFVCAAAFACKQWQFLAQQFGQEFAVIREGESGLLELWFRRQALIIAAREDIPNDDALLARVRAEAEPPYQLDFRMVPPRVGQGSLV